MIIALGIANVLADGFSMAASNYSGTKAELDDRNRKAVTQYLDSFYDTIGDERKVERNLVRKCS